MNKSESFFVNPKENIEDKFKESKVRSEDGKLLTVYHYSDNDFDEFSSTPMKGNYEGDEGFFGAGIYFTDTENAFQYGKHRYAAYLNLKNPLVIKNPTIKDIKNLHGKSKELLDQGYDGVMIWNDKIKDETKTIFGKPQLIRGKKAGWSEIVVLNPDDIHILEK